MDIPLFIWIFIGNFFCYIMGTLEGRKSWGAKLFGRSRAWIKIYKNDTSELHVETLGDSFRMMRAICGHLKVEGYEVDKILEAYYAALIKGKAPAGSEEEA